MRRETKQKGLKHHFLPPAEFTGEISSLSEAHTLPRAPWTVQSWLGVEESRVASVKVQSWLKRNQKKLLRIRCEIRIWSMWSGIRVWCLVVSFHETVLVILSS